MQTSTDEHRQIFLRAEWISINKAANDALGLKHGENGGDLP